MTNALSAGFLRLHGTGPDGFAVTGFDCTLEVMQADGTWLPLRGVCSWKMSLLPDKFATAEIRVELGELCIDGIPMDQVFIQYREARGSRWNQIKEWVIFHFIRLRGRITRPLRMPPLADTTIRLRWYVRPVAFCAAVLGFLVCLVAPKTGTRYTNAVIRWIMRVGVVVE